MVKLPYNNISSICAFPQQSGKLIIESARFDASIAKTVQSV